MRRSYAMIEGTPLGPIASHYKIPMAYVDRMTQAGAGPLLAQNLAY